MSRWKTYCCPWWLRHQVRKNVINKRIIGSFWYTWYRFSRSDWSGQLLIWPSKEGCMEKGNYDERPNVLMSIYLRGKGRQLLYFSKFPNHPMKLKKTYSMETLCPNRLFPGLRDFMVSTTFLSPEKGAAPLKRSGMLGNFCKKHYAKNKISLLILNFKRHVASNWKEINFASLGTFYFPAVYHANFCTFRNVKFANLRREENKISTRKTLLLNQYLFN